MATHGRPKKSPRAKSAPGKFKPFDASKYPHRDYRGEKVVRGRKVRC